MKMIGRMGNMGSLRRGPSAVPPSRPISRANPVRRAVMKPAPVPQAAPQVAPQVINMNPPSAPPQMTGHDTYADGGMIGKRSKGKGPKGGMHGNCLKGDFKK